MAKEESYFEVLPEGCIADVVARTTPVDACSLSLVATTFRSAADSDVVWERFLPSDYKKLISRAEETNHSLDFDSKKKLYLYLCDHPLIIDGGSMSFWLDKRRGTNCFMIAAKELAIVWGATPQYWRWTHHPESRFTEVAELVNVCWLEIYGKISTSMLTPNKAYTAYLVFKQSTRSFGFEDNPIDVSIGITGGDSINRTVYLDPEGGVYPRNFTAPRRIGGIGSILMGRRERSQGGVSRETNNRYKGMRKDGWLEIELGEYFIKEGENQELEMTFKEVNGGNWKSGLIVQGIEIRPKGGK